MDILKYEKLVNKIASKYSNYSNYEDLKQVGMIGLLKAINNYKENQDTKFSTYAYIWIKGEILEYLRCDRDIKLSKELVSLSIGINRCLEVLRNRLNREPTYEEIALFLDVSIDKVEEAMLSKDIVLSLDYSIVTSDKDINLYDAIPYYEKRFSSSYLDLYNEISKLSEEEQKLIKLRYFNDLTQSEVSKILNTNQVSVSRKEEKILSKLNKSLVA